MINAINFFFNNYDKGIFKDEFLTLFSNMNIQILKEKFLNFYDNYLNLNLNIFGNVKGYKITKFGGISKN